MTEPIIGMPWWGVLEAGGTGDPREELRDAMRCDAINSMQGNYPVCSWKDILNSLMLTKHFIYFYFFKFNHRYFNRAGRCGTKLRLWFLKIQFYAFKSPLKGKMAAPHRNAPCGFSHKIFPRISNKPLQIKSQSHAYKISGVQLSTLYI